MFCRVSDLKCKEVVNVNDGCCLGCVSDLELDVQCAQITAIVIYGRPKLFGLLGREEDIIICWNEIQCIGEDAILVKFCYPQGKPRRRESVFDKLFG